MPNVRCCACQQWKNKTRSRLINSDSYAWIREKLNLVDDPDEDIFVCSVCERSVRRENEKENHASAVSNSEVEEVKILFDEYLSSPDCDVRCCVCRALLTGDAVELSNAARVDLLIDNDLYVSPGTRVCIRHLFRDRILPDITIDLNRLQPLSFNVASAKELINDLVSQLRMARDRPRLDLEDPHMTDDDVKMWTGWRREEISKMHESIEGFMKQSKNRSSELALIMFWMKLRTNLSYDQIGTLMNYKSASGYQRKRVSEACSSVQKALLTYFVPHFLGAEHLTRTQALAHQTIYSKTFFGENVALILDGTYYYIQKSQDHAFQRTTYSGQKKRHLVKMLSITFPDGYIVDTVGPFSGAANDASITESILQLNDSLQLWTEDGDTVIVDRGFRNSIGSLEDAGFEARMPAFLPAQQKQLSTADSNATRLVTKNRWTVEAYHGRIKKWALLSECIHNSLLPNIASYVRIVTAAINCFRKPVFSPTDTEQHKLLADSMLALSNSRNELADLVKSGDLNARTHWTNVDAANVNFPRLDESELLTLFYGSYQLKQSRLYVEQHFGPDGDFVLQTHSRHPNIIRCRIHSRHRSSVEYYCWINIKPDGDRDENDPLDIIQAAYCQCKAGNKNVGFCAHTACIIWYLAYARHQDITVSTFRQYLKTLLLPLL